MDTPPHEYVRPGLGLTLRKPAGNASIVCKDPTLIALKVGPGGANNTFFVHRGVLCDQSPYFRAALAEGRWQEGQDGAVALDETDPDLFEGCLAEWLYTGRGLTYAASLDLVQAYVFADRYDFPALRAAIVEQFFHNYGYHHHRHSRTTLFGGGSSAGATTSKAALPSMECVVLAFEALPPSCKLCELLVDIYGARWDPRWHSSALVLDQLPPAFVVPWVRRLGERESCGNRHNLGHYRERRQDDPDELGDDDDEEEEEEEEEVRVGTWT